MNTNKKTILVTGATGFLGENVCLALKREGYEVIGSGRNRQKGRILTQKGISFRPANLENPKEVEHLLAGVDSVIHSAALSSPWGKYNDFYLANVVSTKNLLAAALKKKIKKFVHISTPSVYFNYEDRFNIKESDPLANKAPSYYTGTKLMAEKWVDHYESLGLKTLTLRPRGLFGPGDTSVLPRLIKAFESGSLPQIGDGQNQIDLTYIDNVVHAVKLGLESKMHGKKYNITNDEPVVLWDFLKNLFHELGLPQHTKRSIPYKFGLTLAFFMELYAKVFKTGEPALTRYTVGLLSKSQTLSIEAAKKDLGYGPVVPMNLAFERVIADWKKQNETSRTYRL